MCIRDRGIADAGDVEIAPARAFAMLVEDRFAARVGKEFLGQRLFKAGTQAAREVDDDLPVMTRFAGSGHRRHDVRDPPLGVGQRPFLLSPSRRRQHQVGPGGGIGMRVCFLQDLSLIHI